ncbi:ABC transporter substrate binding protein [Desulfobacterales bacterium HSG2]|nr:ABC transporter substrate binding protein [Desulfobacterales bacterium HSG2]
MRIRYIFFIALTCLLGSLPVFAGEKYGFVKSKGLRQADEIIQGFTGSFPGASVSVLDMGGRKDEGRVRRFIRSERPSVIICLGSLAAKTVLIVEKEIPVIFAMVINYKKYDLLRQKNVTGVSMEIPAMSLFTQFRMFMPEIRSIGAPYHPRVSSEIVREAAETAKRMGIRLTKIEISDSRDMKRYLRKNQSSFRGLWMLADTRLYNRKTRAIHDLISFSKETKKPLLAFSEAFLRSGAFFSVSIDYRSLGSQIALISRQIAEDRTPVSRIPVAPPIGTYTVINKEAAESLMGKDLDESILDEADKIWPE